MTIYTYGSGEFVYNMLEAVKMLMAGGVILGLLKIVLITSLLAGLVSATIGQLLGGAKGAMAESALKGAVEVSPLLLIVRTGLFAAIAVYLLMNPYIVTDVTVEDRYDPGQSRVATSVPMGIAFIGYVSSVVGDKMGETIEELITPVEAVRFRTGGGVGIGPKYVNNLFDIMPPGPASEYGGSSNIPTRGVVEAWFSKCIYSQFGLIEGEGAKAEGFKAFRTTDFILNDTAFQQPPFNDPNTPLPVQYIGSPSASETTCLNAPAQILTHWYDGNVFSKWISRFSASHFGTKEDDPTVIPRVYDMVDRYFPGVTLGTQDKLVQLAVLNSAYAAYVKFASEYSALGSADIAKKKQGGTWIEMARTGTKSLFVMRQIAEAAAYMFGAFLPVFIATAGLGVLFKYVKFVFWLQLWVPIFVIFNAIADYQLIKAIDSVSSCYGGSCSLILNFETIDKLRTETGYIIGYIGLLSISAPGIAWGILKGGESLGGMVGSAMASSAAGSVGGKAATERTGALTHYTTGTGLASAAAAGMGQSQMQHGMAAVDKYGGLGAYGDSIESAMRKNLSVDRHVNAGAANAADMMSIAAIQTGAGTQFEKGISEALKSRDMYEFAKRDGLVSPETSFSDYVRQIDRHQTVNMADGSRRTDYYAPGGNVMYSTHQGEGAGGTYSFTTSASGKVVAGTREGIFTFTDKAGNERAIEGKLTMQGGGYTATGVDKKSGQYVTVSGAASDINLQRGDIKGFNNFHETDQRGTKQDLTMSKSEALQMFSGQYKGTDFYKGLQGMKDGQAVHVTAQKDQAGRYASVTATQGGDSRSTDHSGKLTGHTNLHNDIDQTVVRKGTDISTGWKEVVNNSKTTIGAWTDPQTGEMFNVTLHQDPATGKVIGGQMQNVVTGSTFASYTEKDKNGNTVTHTGHKSFQRDPKTGKEVSEFTETSRRTIDRFGYATQETISPDGKVLMRTGDKGTKTTEWQRFMMELQKGANVSLLGGFITGNDDLQQLEEWQKKAIKAGGATKTGLDATKEIVTVATKGKVVLGGGSGGRGSVPQPNLPRPTRPPRATRETRGPIR